MDAFKNETKNDYGSLELDTAFYKPVFYCQLTAGSVVNIKPELVLEAMAKMNGFEYDTLDYQIHRLEMYADKTAKKERCICFILKHRAVLYLYQSLENRRWLK